MTGVETVLEVLEEADFLRLARPLTVAGVEFEFEAAARGTGASHDLVVVASSSMPARRLLRLVGVLARTLDMAQSPRPVTVIVLGPMAASDKSDLERSARVLILDTENPTAQQVARAAAVLLPMRLPSVMDTGGDPLGEVIAVLGPDATAEHMRFVDAAVGGPERVRTVLRDYVDAVVPVGEGDDD